jgi:WD40 repeat protein
VVVDLTKFDGRISAVAFSRDGSHVTTGHVDGMVRRFHARTGEPESDLPVGAFESQRRVNCLAWSPNGHVLASGGDDGNLVVLDWPAEVGSRPVLRLVGDHKHDPIWGVAWSPDGRYIATAGGDERVCVWDLLTGFQFSIHHPASVWSVSWSTDVRYLATACRDGLARVWSLWHGQENS